MNYVCGFFAILLRNFRALIFSVRLVVVGESPELNATFTPMVLEIEGRLGEWEGHTRGLGSRETIAPKIFMLIKICDTQKIKDIEYYYTRLNLFKLVNFLKNRNVDS